MTHNKRKAFLYCFLGLASLASLTWPSTSFAQKSADEITEKISKFLNMPKNRLVLECPGKSIDFPVLNDKKAMRFCLERSQQQQRCEVAIKGLKRSPKEQKISYETLIENSASKPEKWFSIMQIHSFPDQGEKWRCPPFSLEYHNNTIRLFNRYDPYEISKTTGYNCAEAGSTITSQNVFKDSSASGWIKLAFDLALSHKEDGKIKTTMNGRTFPVLRGSNIYNDKQDPFLKFGIYKPTSWDKNHKISCVTYRDIDISGMSE